MFVKDRIGELLAQRDWSEYKLAQEADLPTTTISSWFTKGRSPNIASLEKICHAFGITLSQFFNPDGEAMVLTEQQKEMLAAWDLLTNDQKQTLLAFLKTL